MTAGMRYSPRPMEEYILRDLHMCEVSVIAWMGEPLSSPVWNLFWLSVPDIDHLLGNPPDWWKGYQSRNGALTSVMSDVMENDDLRAALVTHPEKFSEWFESRDATAYAGYHMLGGLDWRETVLNRAALAAGKVRLRQGGPS